MIWRPWRAIRRRDRAIAALREIVRLYEGHFIKYAETGDGTACQHVGELRQRNDNFVDGIVAKRLDGRET